MPFNGQRMFWGGFEKIIESAEGAQPQQAATPLTA
jgi:hypothetical protein